jgi:hypothetical protein
LDALLEAERQAVDEAVARGVHERFVVVDGELKRVVTDHQLSGASAVADADVARLGEVHRAVAGILDDAITLAPRLAPYATRLDRAMTEVVSGDDRYLAHPMVDSYHSVWFELHEELLHLASLARAELEEAGGA